MVDGERLLALLARLEGVEGELRRMRGVDPSVLRADVDRLYALKYLFVMATEIAIDAGQHVIASERFGPPATFAAVFEELARHGWLDTGLAASLASMARFRNLLVHGYAEIDDDKVVEILHSDALDDLRAFRSALGERAAGSS